ncbi:hypothetical protein ACLMJK_008316 [Lecanora helva]
MPTATPLHTSPLSLPPETYIYSLLPLSPPPTPLLAAISSDNSLRFVDPHTLTEIPDGVFEDVHEGDGGVTCLANEEGEGSGGLVFTAGRDGVIRGWDGRVRGGKIGEWRDVTPHTLLSGSTDGLLNIYDLRQPEEDALIQIINHGHSIHHAEFLSEREFFGLSHDEDLSVYGIDEEGGGEEGREDRGLMTAFGDLRARLGCEYVVDVIPPMVGGGGGNSIVGAGSHTKQQLELVSLRPVRGKGAQSWEFGAPETLIRLPGAHGEEIVRSMCCFDNKKDTIFTAGEDGKIRAWQMDGRGRDDDIKMEMEGIEGETLKKKKKKRNSMDVGEKKGRYKPY